jgi:hypothetical protein
MWIMSDALSDLSFAGLRRMHVHVDGVGVVSIADLLDEGEKSLASRLEFARADATVPQLSRPVVADADGPDVAEQLVEQVAELSDKLDAVEAEDEQHRLEDYLQRLEERAAACDERAAAIEVALEKDDVEALAALVPGYESLGEGEG